MTTMKFALLPVCALMLNACSTTTPINKLTLPPVSTIEGHITQVDEGGFILKDDSGSIYVRVKMPDRGKPDISVAEQVKVYGNLQGGPKKAFDGYVIEKSTGKQIIVSRPTPHFGFVIQSAFR